MVDPVGDNRLVRETPYDTTLTVASDSELAEIKEVLGAAWMSDGTGSPGPYSQTPTEAGHQ